MVKYEFNRREFESGEQFYNKYKITFLLMKITKYVSIFVK